MLTPNREMRDCGEHYEAGYSLERVWCCKMAGQWLRSFSDISVKGISAWCTHKLSNGDLIGWLSQYTSPWGDFIIIWLCYDMWQYAPFHFSDHFPFAVSFPFCTDEIHAIVHGYSIHSGLNFEVEYCGACVERLDQCGFGWGVGKIMWLPTTGVLINRHTWQKSVTKLVVKWMLFCMRAHLLWTRNGGTLDDWTLTTQTWNCLVKTMNLLSILLCIDGVVLALILVK